MGFRVLVISLSPTEAQGFPRFPRESAEMCRNVRIAGFITFARFCQERSLTLTESLDHCQDCRRNHRKTPPKHHQSLQGTGACRQGRQDSTEMPGLPGMAEEHKTPHPTNTPPALSAVSVRIPQKTTSGTSESPPIVA